MTKKQAMIELDSIYPYISGIGRASEHDKYSEIIRKYKWNSKELDRLIKILAHRALNWHEDMK